MLTKLEVEGEFASFEFPKYVWTLPKGNLQKRLESMRNRVCGPYYGGSPRPTAGKGAMFYLDSDFAPGLRWKYCDLVDGVGRRIKHRGWYCDEYCDQTIRGIVMRLPKGRGFLSGWTMGDGMASHVFTQHSFETEVEAAIDADHEARFAAEREREFQEKERLRMEEEEAKERALEEQEEREQMEAFGAEVEVSL